MAWRNLRQYVLSGRKARRSEVGGYLWPGGMDLGTGGPGGAGWNQEHGSKNHPVVAAAAMGDYRWVAALCRYEGDREDRQRGGLFSHEFGSPGYYFWSVVLAKMVALRDAERAGAARDAEAIRDTLAAVWSLLALAAMPTARKRCWANLRGEIRKHPGNAPRFDGLTCAIAGSRWGGQDLERLLVRDAASEMLTWALDWPGRHSTWARTNISKGQWWEGMVARLAGVDSYKASTPPGLWGLEPEDRHYLRRLVRREVEPGAAVRRVSRYGLHHRARVSIRRSTWGTEMVFYRGINGNGPAHAATSVSRRGIWRTLRPGILTHTGANDDFEVETTPAQGPGKPGRVRAFAQGQWHSMPALGGEAFWVVRLQNKRTQLAA